MQPVPRAANGGPSVVWIVEDNEDYGQTVQELVEEPHDLTCPRVFPSGEGLLEYMNGHFAPDVVLVDIGLPGMSGIEVVEKIHGVSPFGTHLVMLTIHEDDDRIFKALCAGATGYLLKTATPEEILDAIRDVLKGGAPMTSQIARRVINLFTQLRAPRGDYQLTSRELEVLNKLVAGKSKKQIAASLELSKHTVDTHIRNVYAKLHVHTRAAAVAEAFKSNLVSPDANDRD